MKYEESSVRDLEFILDQEKKFQIIKNHLLNQRIFIKKPPFSQEAKIIKIFEQGNRLVLKLSATFDFRKGTRISFFRMLAVYTELNCVFIEKLNDGSYVFQLESLCIAKKGRNLDRLPMPIEVAYVTNIFTHKPIAQEDKSALSGIVFETFEKYRIILQNAIPGNVILGVFREGLDHKFNIVKKTGKPLLISNTADPNCYRLQSSNILNYETEVESDILSSVQNYKRKGIVSELLVPILYPNGKGESVSIGFIYRSGDSNHFTLDDLSQLESISNEISNLILNSNSTKILDHIKIMDISHGGMRLKITGSAAVQKLITQKELCFDLVFRGQGGIPLKGSVRWTAKEASDILYLGIEFQFDQSQGLYKKRLEANIETLRKEYIKILNRHVS